MCKTINLTIVCEDSDEPPTFDKAGALRCISRKEVTKGADMCASLVRYKPSLCFFELPGREVMVHGLWWLVDFANLASAYNDTLTTPILFLSDTIP